MSYAAAVSGSGFRASANEDPHGTREAFRALSPTAREQLARPVLPGAAGVVTTGVVGALGLGIVAIAGWDRDAYRWLAALPVAAMAAGAFLWHRPSRIREADGALELVAPGHRVRRHPWHEVAALTVNEQSITVVTRVAGRSRRDRVPFVVAPGEVGPSGIPLGGSTWEWLAGLLTGVVMIGLAVSYIRGRDLLPALAGSIAATTLAVGVWLRRGPRVRAVDAGLAVGTELIPWSRVIGAQPRVKTPMLLRTAPQVRIYLEDRPDLELTVEDAEATVATIARLKARAVPSEPTPGR